VSGVRELRDQRTGEIAVRRVTRSRPDTLSDHALNR
jgi:hypothetical protein